MTTPEEIAREIVIDSSHIHERLWKIDECEACGAFIRSIAAALAASEQRGKESNRYGYGPAELQNDRYWGWYAVGLKEDLIQFRGKNVMAWCPKREDAVKIVEALNREGAS